jgi:alcohol dehydrogenase
MRNYWSFQGAGQLIFGRGSLAELGRLCTKRGYSKVFLLADHRLQQAGLVERVLQPLQEANIAVTLFAQGAPEPAIELALAACEAAKACHPTAIIGLGGGSNMDLAKITAALYTHGGHPEKYFGFDRIPGAVLPLICIPTTSGTGSEVSHAAVLTDTQNKMKVSTLSPYLRPTLALVDPALTDGCPQQVTADSGIDALTHAIEAYTATDYNALTTPPAECAYEGRYLLGETIAEQAIRLIGQHLHKAVHEPNNIAARDGMALAATLAGIAFSNCGVALVHALEYPLGGALHCSHGAGNGLLLPYVMRFLLPHRTQELAKIAQLLGADTSKISEQAAAELAINRVNDLRAAIGIPGRIRELGGKREQLPEFAAKSFAIKRLMATTPCPTSEAKLLSILEDAF